MLFIFIIFTLLIMIFMLLIIIIIILLIRCAPMPRSARAHTPCRARALAPPLLLFYCCCHYFRHAIACCCAPAAPAHALIFFMLLLCCARASAHYALLLFIIDIITLRCCWYYYFSPYAERWRRRARAWYFHAAFSCYRHTLLFTARHYALCRWCLIHADCLRPPLIVFSSACRHDAVMKKDIR